MLFPKIENLQTTEVTEDILLVHQIKTPFYFSCCDGLLVLPKKGRNENTIALDLNVEPNLVEKVNYIYGPISDYICSHGHMDHIAHVHAWEDLGAKIHGPNPEAQNLTNLRNFYKCYNWDEMIKYSLIEKFGELNKYHNCNKVQTFEPGDKLKFGEFEFETIPLTGHSISQVGFYLPIEQILHISCLGFDQTKPGANGFGPWYGFKQCSISQYIEDINKTEIMFLEGAKYLTSSHAYVVKNPDKTPFEYMRGKIKENQHKVDTALMNIKPTQNFEIKIKQLLKMDIFFPKRKMNGFLKKIYSVWEYWLLVKHAQRSKILKY
ncbi:MAG: MBL fold metallo-hydrolase [Candidatus Hermodarchaeota archaeon]